MDPATKKRRQISLGRRLAFRAVAVTMGLAIVLAVEGALRLTPWGRTEDVGDPFVGFSDIVPLFVLNDAGTEYEIPLSRQAFFQPETFPAQKGTSEFRIFCLGGSTVQGRPYSIETSFTTWLQLGLQAADSSKDWRAVNCGGVSYASYRLVPILQEVLGYEPDMLIVYTGHNEFLEQRTYPHVKQLPKWIKRLHYHATKCRIYGVTRNLLQPRSQPARPASLPTEVDALLDYQGGLAKYHRDDSWQNGVVQHYEHNLRRMVHLARQAGVPLLLVNPVANLRDTPPFKVEIASHLTGPTREEFERRWEQAKSSDWQDLQQKAELARHVLALDDRHANAHFLLAKIYDAIGDAGGAKEHYLRAKDEDICPLRMTEPLHDVLAQVARQTSTPLIDIRQLFEQQAEGGIPGDDLLIDHVHPRIEGHQHIAQELFDFFVQEGIVEPRPDFELRKKRLFRSNYEELPANYFPESAARLEGLQRWTEGRVTRLRLE